ncbi:hypothetical protein GCM10009604_14950 [Corynebacterium aurimucosum]
MTLFTIAAEEAGAATLRLVAVATQSARERREIERDIEKDSLKRDEKDSASPYVPPMTLSGNRALRPSEI